MSATVYHEPYRLPAGILALAVHSVFFALLYLGFSWNKTASLPATMSVELWQSLPEVAVAPPVTPKVDEVAPPPPPPPPQEEAVKPDIVMPEKKKVVAKPVIKPEKKKPEPKLVKPEPQPVIQEPVEKKPEVPAVVQETASARAERIMREEQAAAKGKMVDEYKAKIQAKIKRNIVEPPDVRDNINAKFLVTLLPGGTVLKAELALSSGNAAYDNAVERAILKSSPLPLPEDMKLFNEFRQILMTFKPEKPTR